MDHFSPAADFYRPYHQQLDQNVKAGGVPLDAAPADDITHGPGAVSRFLENQGAHITPAGSGPRLFMTVTVSDILSKPDE